MQFAILTLVSKRDEQLKQEKAERSKADMYAGSANAYAARAAEYQRAIDLLEAAAATEAVDK